MNNLPAAKIKMMKASMRCAIFGVLGLAPIIGVPFALAALWFSFSARRLEKRFWNAAKPYRITGLICASFGALIWSAVDMTLIYDAICHYVNA